VLDDDVVFGDEEVQLAAPVGEARPDHGGAVLHCTAERGVVVDEVRTDVAVERIDVALGEDRLDELGDDCLVLLLGGHVAIMRTTLRPAYPN
jgi:hypothetical protein